MTEENTSFSLEELRLISLWVEVLDDNCPGYLLPEDWQCAEKVRALLADVEEKE